MHALLAAGLGHSTVCGTRVVEPGCIIEPFSAPNLLVFANPRERRCISSASNSSILVTQWLLWGLEEQLPRGVTLGLYTCDRQCIGACALSQCNLGDLAGHIVPSYIRFSRLRWDCFLKSINKKAAEVNRSGVESYPKLPQVKAAVLVLSHKLLGLREEDFNDDVRALRLCCGHMLCYIAVVAAFDLDLQKNFDTDVRTRFGPPMVERIKVPNLHPDLRVRPLLGDSASSSEARRTALRWMTDTSGGLPIHGVS
eukprot:6481638-Amphidinium_carterae.1